MRRHIIACAFALLAASQTACIPERTPDQQETPGATVVSNVGPEFARDDASIYFASDRSGSGDIFRVSLAGTTVVQLTSYANEEWTTRGSATPDGHYLIETRVNGYFVVAKFNPVTGQQTPFLASNGAHYRCASYSPDGARIVYSRAVSGGYYKLWIANADGSSARQLTVDAGQDWKGSLSPAGRVVFQRVLNGQADLMVIDDPTAANIQVRNLSNTRDVDEYDPVFSRAEERIYFVQGKLDGAGRISSVLQDGSDGRVVIDTGGHFSDIALSYNGQRLAYVHRPDAASPRDIYLATTAGAPVKRLTRGALGPEE